MKKMKLPLKKSPLTIKTKIYRKFLEIILDPFIDYIRELLTNISIWSMNTQEKINDYEYNKSWEIQNSIWEKKDESIRKAFSNN